ncbi:MULTISPECIES: mechanosensitive ion channel family protein [unclassified Pseudoalteromonas]|uniref:mechanosensitive ion channel family protein n=1 Tax=unclassified Pseudoalteromonas TaxID=194690 RepID=UPI000CF7002F|nr:MULTISPECIES: mechanosensitive ion channel domain-containing protein [unclassified Pseudoalteromonas]MBS3797688.1 mechanosensitive ion channel [Pseudoalteromonas sp. BDTF-M6]
MLNSPFLEKLTQALQTVVFSYGGSEFTVAKLIQIPLIILVVWVLVRYVGKLIHNKIISKRIGPDAALLFKRIYLVLCVVIIVFTTLEVLNIPLTAFAFVSGAVAIGVGFGAQNIINNFISGWILIWERPIRIGDFLEVGDAKGVVETINTRSTRIRRSDGVHMLVPNSQLLENTVTNWTLIDTMARTNVRVGVAYGSDVNLVAKLINEVLNENQAVLKTPVPTVIFADFGDNALVFDAVFWVNAEAEASVRKVKSDIRFAICAKFAAQDVVIAFPQRDVHMDGELIISHKKSPD